MPKRSPKPRGPVEVVRIQVDGDDGFRTVSAEVLDRRPRQGWTELTVEYESHGGTRARASVCSSRVLR